MDPEVAFGAVHIEPIAAQVNGNVRTPEVYCVVIAPTAVVDKWQDRYRGFGRVGAPSVFVGPNVARVFDLIRTLVRRQYENVLPGRNAVVVIV